MKKKSKNTGNDMEQLLLFAEPLEGKLLREVAELKESLNKVRKGQFAKIGDLSKKYDDLLNRLSIIEEGLCKTALPDRRFCEIIEMALL